MAFDEPGQDSGALSQINVTPLVDVMLVMLVIFMVAAPILQQGVELELPRETIAPIEGEGEQLVVSIDAKGLVYIGAGNLVEVAKLGKRVGAIIKDRADKRVFIRADKKVAYGHVMEVMGEIRRAGIEKVGLVTEPG
ncbi:MAG: protein TolR [Deltaproteobacteria bacterium]|nr:protein TolR [Deltaproteobacteria bacterium]